jgi:glycosyltransferase involved in cell wall biosynthesis
MSAKPKISVITVCFNSESTIEDSILSVKHQDYQDFEHIIIDGASTDETLSVIKANKHDKLKVFSAPDRGIYDAMNKGLTKVSGDIVVFLNADDWYAGPNIFSTVAKNFNKNLDYIYGDLSFVSGQDKKIIRKWQAKSKIPFSLISNSMPPFPAMFFNVKVFKVYGLFFDTTFRISGDYDFCIKLHQYKTVKTAYILCNMVFMRYGGASTAGPIAIYKSNREVLKALKNANVKAPLFNLFLKLMSKIRQFTFNVELASYFWQQIAALRKPIKSQKKSPSVAILLCTFQGDKYLKDQLNSIALQTYTNWKLYVSDDGSDDATLTILKNYQTAWGRNRIEIQEGPRRGFQNNFMSLITSKDIHADFYMLCDQDDVWLPQKIYQAINHLAAQDLTKPQLYCGRTTYVSKELKFLQYSQLFRRPPSFKNALVQSIGGGNTMAFNNALKNVTRKFLKVEIVSHDWWLYMLTELFKGRTFYDTTPLTLYRQHKNSLIGENTTVFAKIKRIKRLLSGEFADFNDIHLEAFNKIRFNLVSSENARVIDLFYNTRQKNIFLRLKMVRELGIYRQSWGGQLALYFAAFFKLI